MSGGWQWWLLLSCVSSLSCFLLEDVLLYGSFDVVVGEFLGCEVEAALGGGQSTGEEGIRLTKQLRIG